MNKTETSIENSNNSDLFDEAAMINSLTKYLSNEPDSLTNKSIVSDLVYQNDLLSVNPPNAAKLPINYDKMDLSDGDVEIKDEKMYTTLKTVEFTNPVIEELNASKESEGFEELVNLEDVKNIEELENFKISQNFEESIDLEEIKNIEQIETLDISQNFEESVNFEDIKNIEGSVIIELDDVELSQIQNSTQESPYLVIKILSEKLKDEEQNTDHQKSDLINNNKNEPNSQTTNESEDDTNSPNSISQLSNNKSSENLRERIKKRKRKLRNKVDTTEIEDNKFEVADQKIKALNDDLSDITFIRPITPDKIHKTKKPGIDNNSGEHNILLSSSPTLSPIQKNLTDEEKMKFDTSQDIINSSDNEFEQICNFIKNGSYDPAQLSMNTLELMDEFTEIDQSINEKLLADLINSPTREDGLIQEECQSMSTPEIKQDNEDVFEISSKRKRLNNEEPNVLEPVEDQIKYDNLVEMANGSVNVENQNDSENEKVSSSNGNDSSYKEDDSSYNGDDSSYSEDDSSHSEIDEDSSEIDIEKLKKKTEKVQKSLIIKKDVRKKLAEFIVKLKHEVPPQHMVEKSLSAPPSRRIQSLFKEYIPMRSGTYIASEDKIIKENWKYFCKVHKWDSTNVKPFLHFRYKGRVLIKNQEAFNFARFLARGLPSRTLYSVVGRFRRLFRSNLPKRFKYVRLQYTAKEDKIIMAYCNNKEIMHQGRITELAQLLGRPYGSVYTRWRVLKGKEGKNAYLSQHKIEKNVEWTVPLAEKFLKKLMKLTLSDDVRELHNLRIPPIIWEKLERRMKISKNCLKGFWGNRLHAQLFYERPFFRNDVKIILIEYLYVKGVKYRDEIDWLEIRELFDGIPITYVMKMFYAMLRSCSSKVQRFIGDSIEWLYEHRIERMKHAKIEGYLPGAIYEDGKLKVFHRSYPTVQDCDINNSSEDI